MSLVDLLDNVEIWEDFLAYKLSGNRLTEEEKKYFTRYISAQSYKNITPLIKSGRYVFNIPQKKYINKSDNMKKRAVYVFDEDETMVLKLLSYLLYKYDYIFSSNLFSFRKDTGIKKALYSIIDRHDIENMASYKIDISDYFNSIDIPILKAILNDVFYDDEKTLDLLCSLLENEKVSYKSEIIAEKKGVMAGSPISSFLANVYLMEMDQYFYDNGKIYARYSDDIIVFDYPENLQIHIDKIDEFIKRYKLEINPKKVLLTEPHEEWTFLGFKYHSGKIDISKNSVDKIKAKIRRQARKLRRWMLKKDAIYERALWAMNKKFNRKFYSFDTGHELSWARWYFPIINTDESLKEIDLYMQQMQRYIVTGLHNKANYRKVPYDKLKQCAYRPLVAAYYEFKNDLKA